MVNTSHSKQSPKQQIITGPIFDQDWLLFGQRYKSLNFRRTRENIFSGLVYREQLIPSFLLP